MQEASETYGISFQLAAGVQLLCTLYAVVLKAAALALSTTFFFRDLCHAGGFEEGLCSET